MLRKQYPHQKLPNVSNIENLHSLVSLTCTGAFLCPLQKVECFLPPLCLNPSVSLCSGQRRWQTTWGCSASRSWSRIPLRRRLPEFKRSNPSCFQKAMHTSLKITKKGHPPSWVAILHVFSGGPGCLAFGRKAWFLIRCPGVSQVLGSAARTNVGPIDNDVVITIWPLEKNKVGKCW